MTTGPPAGSAIDGDDRLASARDHLVAAAELLTAARASSAAYLVGLALAEIDREAVARSAYPAPPLDSRPRT